ncbi:MAG: hypothetical protein VKJ27_03750 [Synechocystis sp.]|nr:hypothetical protein [Synechocystis sp.]
MSITILIIVDQPLAAGRSPAYPNQRLDLELNQFDWIFTNFLAAQKAPNFPLQCR